MGKVFQTGKIGRLRTLRNVLALPGEQVHLAIPAGKVYVAPLRQRAVTSANAGIWVFASPVRWLTENWPDYVREGPNGTKTLNTETVTNGQADTLALGGYYAGATVWDIFPNHYRRIANEWFKWPEEADFSSTISNDGYKMVSLAHHVSRITQFGDIGSGNYRLDTHDKSGSSREEIDIRELAALEAEYGVAVKEELFVQGRYMDFIKEMFGGSGSAEVDKVPRLVGSTVARLDSRERYAMDGPSLGESFSLGDFYVGHDFGTMVFPEHTLVTMVMGIRFDPVFVDEINPVARMTGASWAEVVGHYDMLAQMPPVDVKLGELDGYTSTTVLGKLPAGWQHRAEPNFVCGSVGGQGSFTFHSQIATTAKANRDASDVQNAFLSSQFDDWFFDGRIVAGRRMVPEGARSYFAGATGGRPVGDYVNPRRQL